MTPDDPTDTAPTTDDPDVLDPLDGGDEERASIRAQRLAKLERLRADGVDPYP